jgi:hypothetical protein
VLNDGYDWSCPYLLSTHSEFKDKKGTGRITAVSEQIATRILHGEPDPALFDVPTGLKEVPPSGLLEEAALVLGIVLEQSAAVRERLSTLDMVYWDRRPRGK